MENVNLLLKEFIEYLQLEKNYSQLTIDSYEHELKTFFMFMDEQAIPSINEVTHQDADFSMFTSSNLDKCNLATFGWILNLSAIS